MLVAISGAQGSGKSSIIQELSKTHNVIQRKTSRSILNDWGVSLFEVNNDHDLTIKFQEEITKRKFEDEKDAIFSDELYFTERSHADLFTYALISLGKDNNYSEWIDEYFGKCVYYNQAYSHIFYIKSGLFPVEHDGVRGSNSHYSRMADLVMQDVTKRMTLPNKLSVLNTGNFEQRVSLIKVQSMAMCYEFNPNI